MLKPGYSTELNGVSREYRSSSGALGLVFVLALVFIFLVLLGLAIYYLLQPASPTDKIREIIGPGGKMIRSITDSTGTKIDIHDDGTVNIASADSEAVKKAKGVPGFAETQAYVRKVVDTVNDLDNVLYEISNESTGSTANTNWQRAPVIPVLGTDYFDGRTVDVDGGLNM